MAVSCMCLEYAILVFRLRSEVGVRGLHLFFVFFSWDTHCLSKLFVSSSFCSFCATNVAAPTQTFNKDDLPDHAIQTLVDGFFSKGKKIYLMEYFGREQSGRWVEKSSMHQTFTMCSKALSNDTIFDVFSFATSNRPVDWEDKFDDMLKKATSEDDQK